MLATAINQFCSCKCDANTLEEFYRLLVDVQNKKATIAQVNAWLSTQPPAVLSKSDVSVIDLVYRRIHNYSELDEMRDILCEDLVALLDVLWESLVYSKGIEIVNAIVNHIYRSFPKKIVYKADVLIPTSQKMDVYDVLFNFVFTFVNAYESYDHLQKHIKIAHTLFYYQGKRLKDRVIREPLISNVFAMLVNKEVPVQQAKTTTIQQRLRTNPHEYLNAIIPINETLIEEVRSVSPVHNVIEKAVKVNIESSDTSKYAIIKI